MRRMQQLTKHNSENIVLIKGRNVPAFAFLSHTAKNNIALYCSMAGSKKLFFPNLDGLRFIAFFMVFLWHSIRRPFELLHVENIYLNKLFYLFVNGKTGVSIFFVLSGFLITYLILSEIQLNGKLDVIKFYIRRSLRIWPLYFLLLILIFAVMPPVMNLLHQNWQQFNMQPWWYFVFLSNFDVLHIYLTNGQDLLASTVTWSVAIEEQFYLVWPLLFAFLHRSMYKFIFPALVILCYTFRWLHADNDSILYYHTLSVCGDLALGGWAASLSFTNEAFVNFFKNQSNRQRLFFYTGATLMLYVIQFGNAPFFHVFSRLLQTVFFCYIILDQNFCLQTKYKLGSNRFMSFWGKYTYGLYLWHAFVLMLLTVVASKLLHFSLESFGVHAVIAVAGFAASLLVSYYSYHWFENWFLKLKERFSFIHKA